MQFREEQNAFDHFLLLFVGFSECISVHMDVQTAGVCHMGTIAHVNSLLKDIVPVHLIQMIVKSHRVRDDFKTVIETAVALAVDMFAANVRLLLDSGCALIVFSCPLSALVYDMNDTKKKAPWEGNISSVITSCGNFFTTADGKDLIFELTSLLCYAAVKKCNIVCKD